MKAFHFTKTYFNKTLFEDPKNNIRISVKETPSLDVTEEDYSLRIETRHVEEKIIHRNYAIEHHGKQEKHNKPHIKFKFHTEEIGTFWITLELKDADEYKQAILGFIYKIGKVIAKLEKYHSGITEEILVMDLVSKLKKEEKFLDMKIAKSITTKTIEFDSDANPEEILNNPLLKTFLGENSKKIGNE